MGKEFKRKVSAEGTIKKIKQKVIPVDPWRCWGCTREVFKAFVCTVDDLSIDITTSTLI